MKHFRKRDGNNWNARGKVFIYFYGICVESQRLYQERQQSDVKAVKIIWQARILHFSDKHYIGVGCEAFFYLRLANSPHQHNYAILHLISDMFHKFHIKPMFYGSMISKDQLPGRRLVVSIGLSTEVFKIRCVTNDTMRFCGSTPSLVKVLCS